MKAFILFCIAAGFVACYGLEDGLVAMHEWGERQAAKVERASKRIEAKKPPRELAREYVPLPSERKLYRRRATLPQAEPIPMQERYEQR